MTDGNRSDERPDGWSDILIDVLSEVCSAREADNSLHHGLSLHCSGPSAAPITRFINRLDLEFTYVLTVDPLLELLMVDLLY